jgi:hypothetical protein
MRFVLATGENLTVDDGEKILLLLEKVFTNLKLTLTESEMSEIDIEETKIGDGVLIQEHFFESKITRKKESKNRKKEKEVCMESCCVGL